MPKSKNAEGRNRTGDTMIFSHVDLCVVATDVGEGHERASVMVSSFWLDFTTVYSHLTPQDAHAAMIKALLADEK